MVLNKGKMEIKERVMQFIEYKGITKNKFETECGLPKRYVSNIGNTIQSDVIKKIVLTYPEINVNWLVGLDEPMLRDNKETPHQNVTKDDLIEALRDHITTLKREVEELRREKSISDGYGDLMAAEEITYNTDRRE